MNTSQFALLNDLASTLASLVALIVSIIALVYTVKTYMLKSGAYIRGTYTHTQSLRCDDYVSHIKIENLKDRAIVIFKISLLLGHNNYIEIEDFTDNPLILKPFEIYSKEYSPIDFYVGSNRGRILMNEIFEGSSHKQRKIVLSTSEGKYIVRDYIKHWQPGQEFISNKRAEIIRPIRSSFRGNYYGSNAKYVIEFELENGKSELIPLYSNGDHLMLINPIRTRTLRNILFSLPKGSKTSKLELEESISKALVEGLFTSVKFTVFDIENWRHKTYRSYLEKVTAAKNENWLTYHLVGRIENTIRRLRKEPRPLPGLLNNGMTEFQEDGEEFSASKKIASNRKEHIKKSSRKTKSKSAKVQSNEPSS